MMTIVLDPSNHPSMYHPSSPVQRRVIKPSYTDYTPGNHSYGAYAPQPATPASEVPPPAPTTTTIPHQSSTGFVVLITIITVLFQFDSNIPLHVFMMLSLLLYILDLANLKQALLVSFYASAVILTFTTGFTNLLEANSDGGLETLNYVLYLAFYGILYATAASYLTTQLQWIKQTQQLHFAVHALLPPLFAFVSTQAMVDWIAQEHNRDIAATLSPYFFAILLATSMLMIGTVKQGERFIIDSRTAMTHSSLLLFVPPLSHLATFAGRILSRHAGTDDWYDMALVATIPFLLLYIINSLHNNEIIKSPYAIPHVFPPQGTPVPVIVSLVASFAAQQRYLVPLCHDISYRFMGHKDAGWVISLYWTLATSCAIATAWLWDRKNVNNEPLLGEYHDDVTQLGIVLFGIAVGKAFGMPWNLIPLPVLAFLGFALWAYSRMLRYLAIFLFVLHSTGVVVFTYRFAGIAEKISVLGIPTTFMRFGYGVTLTSILIGLVAGMSVRSNGGFGSSIVRRFDVTGIILALYTILLAVFEITLLKRDLPMQELVGAEVEQYEIETRAAVYRYEWALFTSGVLLVGTYFMHRVKILSEQASCLIASLAIGKGIAIYIDSCDEDIDQDGSPATSVFLQACMTSLLCLIMVAPRIFLHPVYLKTAARSKRSVDGSGNTQLDSHTLRVIAVYSFVFLPITLLISGPVVISPLMNALSSDDQGLSLYKVKQPLSEIVGASIALWGVACLSMTNHYLPDGGGEAFKKLSALAFLLGIGVLFAAPSLGLDLGKTAENPYLALSSLGSQLTRKGKSRTGGWGLLAAAFSTLLALTGPLELKERKSKTGKSDRFLLIRTMSFSLMFGGGIAWFIVMQMMSDSDWMFLVLTSLSCMTIAFVGTVCCVLGYFIEMTDFDDVVMVTNMWGAAFLLFIPFTALPWLYNSMSSTAVAGHSSWFRTYLVVSSCFAFAFSKSLGFRKDKSGRSRAIANISCILSWLCATTALFSFVGVAGLDENYDVFSILGIPVSILGSFVIGLILMNLHSEATSKGNVRRIASTSSSESKWVYSLFKLDDLNSKNRFYPVIGGTALILALATLYTLFLRGSPFFGSGSSIPRSHEDVFSSVYGEERVENDLSKLVDNAIKQSQALTTSAKLAGSGFWTADGLFGPLLHLVGFLVALPMHQLLYTSLWKQKLVSKSTITTALPLNIVPILLCRGIPSLRAFSLIGTIAGAYQLMKKEDRYDNGL